ncbi:MAG: hypothetical protein Q9177_004805 [Variospora cf. flavescens]
MLLPYLAFLLVSHLFHLITAAPAGPAAGHSTDSGLLEGGPAIAVDRNITTFYRNLLRRPLRGVIRGKRPGGDKFYPELTDGKYHLRLFNYGRDIDSREGTDVLAKAAQEVDEWINVARQKGITPVESEHSWRSGPISLTITPANDGYTLDDLKYYIGLMTAFHRKYDLFWEWEAELLWTGGMGALRPRGRANLRGI